jgi:hypothetical protein
VRSRVASDKARSPSPFPTPTPPSASPSPSLSGQFQLMKGARHWLEISHANFRDKNFSTKNLLVVPHPLPGYHLHPPPLLLRTKQGGGGLRWLQTHCKQENVTSTPMHMVPM